MSTNLGIALEYSNSSPPNWDPRLDGNTTGQMYEVIDIIEEIEEYNLDMFSYTLE